MRYFFIIFCTVAVIGFAQAQQPHNNKKKSKDFLQAFSQLPKQDDTISTYDPFNFKLKKFSGHIQGIQLYKHAGTNYLYMTRSAKNAAYIIKAKLENKSTNDASIDTLMNAPYGHPGGFQIFENYLAVGIEDEISRTTSRVMVYDLKKQEKTWSNPLHIVKRDGDYERVTAGCVGLTKVGKNMIMAVGNWHSRNLDFYSCPTKKFKKGKDTFTLIQSLNMAQVSKSDWTDSIWNSYQNINLFVDGMKRIYLVGFMGQQADLFELQIANGDFKSLQKPDQNTIQIKKLLTKNFTISGDASFGAGAGISSLSNGELVLFGAPSDLGSSSTISIYRNGN